MTYGAIPFPANQQTQELTRFISSRAIVFWDFDGVIKDSVDVKTEALMSLFIAYGSDIAARVKVHHEGNSGVSRYEKIPMYLDWAGLPNDQSHIDQFCLRFSEAVLDAVVDSPWISGVREYLVDHSKRQYFVLVTATPQREIENIITRLEIAHCFQKVYGAPTEKQHAIASVLETQRMDVVNTLMIGDSEADLLAAEANKVPFLLRRTAINGSLQSSYAGPQFEDLLN